MELIVRRLFKSSINIITDIFQETQKIKLSILKKKLNELGIREDNIVNTLKEKSLSFSNKNDFKWQGNLKLYQDQM